MELALGVDDEHARNGIDAPRAGEISLPALSLVELRPFDMVFLDELLEAVQAAVLLGLIKADADELDPLPTVFGVEIFHLGHLGDTRAAPCRPEVNDDNLAA